MAYTRFTGAVAGRSPVKAQASFASLILRRIRKDRFPAIVINAKFLVLPAAAVLAGCSAVGPLQTATPRSNFQAPLSEAPKAIPTATALPPSPAATAALAAQEVVLSTPTPAHFPVDGPPPVEGMSIPDMIDFVRPSVVQIAVTISGATRPNVGTGIIYDADGHILTNSHVVDRAQVIKVSKADGEVMTARLLREDRVSDLAVLKIEADGLVAARFGNSDELRVGEEVLAVGHALGLDGGPTVSKGVVSALDRAIVSSSGRQLSGLIQTDAAINEGNSGGPLVNLRGEVVGLNSARMSAGEGVGFALNVNAVRSTAAMLIALGPLPPPGYLGAFGIDIRPALAAALGLPVRVGFGVTQVDEGSPADGAGIQDDDIIIRVDDKDITGGADLNEFLRLHAAGESVVVVVVRGNYLQGFKLHRVDVTLGESP